MSEVFTFLFLFIFYSMEIRLTHWICKLQQRGSGEGGAYIVPPTTAAPFLSLCFTSPTKSLKSLSGIALIL